MAQRKVVVLEDDLDGGAADETVSFALDGVRYEIDLTLKNADRLRDSLAMYIGVARRLGRTGPGRPARGSRGGSRTNGRAKADTAEIRAWARSAGHDISERGRIPANIVDAFNKAHR